MQTNNNVLELNSLGYSIMKSIYSNNEVASILNSIQNSKIKDSDTTSTKNSYAIRQLINVIPNLKQKLFNKNLTDLLDHLFQSDYFLTKAIYFDKPPKSNWFVPYHQDLSISVNEKTIIDDYTNWTFKKGQYGVHPPTNILENTITVRIHLDDTTNENGALKVIPESHKKGIIRYDSENWILKNENVCEVEKGGIMLMKPLLLHASNKTTNKKRRRVIHLEFNNTLLQKPLKWLEFLKIKKAIT